MIGIRPAVLIALGCFCSANLALADMPESPQLPQHESSSADREAIERLLRAYTESVTSRDERKFTALLLDEQIAFSDVSPNAPKDGSLSTARLRDFNGFRDAVFRSPDRFEQRFYNVHISQDGPLAQVDLDFITRRIGDVEVTNGWKVLQLVKVNGAWKIASELYTAK